jgi:hypothetical protein
MAKKPKAKKAKKRDAAVKRHRPSSAPMFTLTLEERATCDPNLSALAQLRG